MLSTLFTWLVLLIVLIAISYAFWRQSKLHQLAHWYQREGMPWELRRASLLASEQTLQCEKPVPLNGIADQIYRTLFGRLILVDSKTRQRAVVYDADIVQLSVYRLILQNTQQVPFAGSRVKNHGYIRLSTPETVEYERVELLDSDIVIDYYHRYQALIGEQSEPDYTDNPALCRQCGHRRVCPVRSDKVPENRSVAEPEDDETL